LLLDDTTFSTVWFLSTISACGDAEPGSADLGVAALTISDAVIPVLCLFEAGSAVTSPLTPVAYRDQNLRTRDRSMLAI